MPNEALTTMLSLMAQDAPLSEDENGLLEFSREVVMTEMFGMSQEEVDRQREFAAYCARLQGMMAADMEIMSGVRRK